MQIWRRNAMLPAGEEALNRIASTVVSGLLSADVTLGLMKSAIAVCWESATKPLHPFKSPS